MRGGTHAGGSVRPVRGSMAANLAHPPLGDRRFWMVQAMVVVAVLVHLAGDLAQDAGVSPAPGFVWTLLLLVPTVYAGTVFGLVGSLGAAVGGIALLAPEELLTRHSSTEAWGAWGILSMVLVTAVLLGYRFEEERSLRHRMVAAERERIMGSFEGHALSWHTLFDALPYGIALVDADGAIRYANGHLEMLSGYHKAQLVGRAVDMLVPANLREHHVAHRNGTRGTSVTRPHGARSGLLLLRRDGVELPVDIALAPLAMDTTPYTVVIVRDDSVREQAERARDDAERRFRLAFEHNVAGMALSSLDGRLVDVNRAYCTMLGLTAADMLGRDVVDVTHPEDRALTTEMNRRLVSGEVEHVSYVKRYLHRDGHVVDANLLTGVVKDESGAPAYLVASVRDVTEERLLAAQLSHQALHDPLTGLPNRALFQERFEHASSASDGRDGWSAVMLLDLDDFKSVNDSLGHDVGDQLLAELARRLSSTARANDMLCRLGGDEFLYLVEGLASAAEARAVARRLLEALAAPFYLAGERVEQHASLGLVIREHLGEDWAELLQDADSALYEAKRQGKGGFATFTPEMREQVSVRFAILQELHQALSSDELSMHYQPIVELASGAVVGFEALMRWQQRTRGPISPDVFIPLAERSGLIAELGKFALREAGLAAASWQQTVGDGAAPYVAVNLSAHQFHDPALLASIDDMLSTAPLAPSRVVVEITESAALVDVVRAARTIEELRRLGVSIALDDFGTGYSSLSYLAKLRPDIIKIDKSFVSSRAESARAASLLSAMVSLGRDLDMIVVAEGIETPEQLAYLRELGCDLGQGYLFSRPVPAVDVAALCCLDTLGAC